MSNYRFLSSVYSDATITAIIEEAINLGYKLTFIDHGTAQEVILTKSNLAAIRAQGLRGLKAEVIIVPPRVVTRYAGEWIGNVTRTEDFGCWQNVDYSDLRADSATFDQIRKKFGDGDKGQNEAICIAFLSSKQVDDRKKQISSMSLETRSESIIERGFEVYSELAEKYRAKFNKEVIAELIRREEKPIYETLGLELPPVASYLKHTRKPSKKAERSK